MIASREENVVDRFEGQVAFITGGASGIGLAAAQRLASEGATVLCADLNDETLGKLPSGLTGVRLDVSDDDAVNEAIAAAESEHGKIDVLVNSAGITGRARTLWETETDYWNQIYAVHVNGTFFTMRAAIPKMIDNGYGRIVNIASVAGKEGNPNSSAYSSAKAAVIGMTKTVGKELATTSVTANAVTPTVFRTPLVNQVTPSHHEYLLSKIPMGRIGEVEEAAAMIAFAASKECSFTTASVFDLSGGRTTY